MTETIGPTALYTGHVWARHGLSDPALDTLTGRVLFEALRPVTTVSGLLGGPTFEGLLLARHRVIDALLTDAIESGRIGSVVEIAAGMSPRGWRFSGRHPELTYIEGDLPGMAERKRRALARLGATTRRHRVVELDATAGSGLRSLDALLGELDPDRGVAVMTEGLLNYLPEDAVRGFWQRTASGLGRFPHGLYLADIALGRAAGNPASRAAAGLLSAFVRGRVGLHFSTRAECERALRNAGFSSPRVFSPAEHPAAGDRRGDAGARAIDVIQASAR